MAPIARRADREEAVAAPTDLLEKRRVHGVGAAAVRSDWTYRPNRGTTDKAASARRSPRRSRGPGGSVRALTLSLRSLRDQPFPRPVPRPWTVPRLWTHSTRPQVAWKTAQNAVSHTAHRLLVFTVEKTDERSQARTARRPPSRFTRFQMSADSRRVARQNRRSEDGQTDDQQRCTHRTRFYSSTVKPRRPKRRCSSCVVAICRGIRRLRPNRPFGVCHYGSGRPPRDSRRRCHSSKNPWTDLLPRAALEHDPPGVDHIERPSYKVSFIDINFSHHRIPGSPDAHSSGRGDDSRACRHRGSLHMPEFLS